jgi:hypothetical protein
MSRGDSGVTIVVIDIMTDAMVVSAGEPAAVAADIRSRFPSEAAAVPESDLDGLLVAIGRTHCIVRLPGRQAVPLPVLSASGRA